MKISEFGDLCGILLGRWVNINHHNYHHHNKQTRKGRPWVKTENRQILQL